MQSYQNKLPAILSAHKAFFVPDYQRRTAWPNTKALQLIEDLMDISQDDSIGQTTIGTITGMVEQDTGNRSVALIDGQQRLTTLTLIAKAIELIVPRNDVGSANLILPRTPVDAHGLVQRQAPYEFSISSDLNTIMHTTNLNGTKIKRLWLGIRDEADFATLMALQPGEPIPVTGGQVNSNFRAIHARLKAAMSEVDHEGVNGIGRLWHGLSKIEVSLNLVDRQHGERPQDIFDRLNIAGTEMTPQSRIWNMLTAELSQEHASKLLAERWRQIELTLDDSEKNFTDLLYCVANQLHRDGRYQIDQDQLYDLYRNEIRFATNRRQASEAMIETLFEASQSYAKVIKPDEMLSATTYREPSSRIRKQMHMLAYPASQNRPDELKASNHGWIYPQEFSLRTSHPVVLYLRQLLDQGKLQEQEYIDALRVIQTFHLHRAVAISNYSASAGLNTKTVPVIKSIRQHLEAGMPGSGVAELLEQELLDDGGVRAWPEYAEVCNGLKYKTYSDQAAKVIHVLVERQMVRESGSREEMLIDQDWCIDHLSSRVTDRNRNGKFRLGNTAMTPNNAQLGAGELQDKVDKPGVGYRFSRSLSNRGMVQIYDDSLARFQRTWGHAPGNDDLVWDEIAIEINGERLGEAFLKGHPVPHPEKLRIARRMGNDQLRRLSDPSIQRLIEQLEEAMQQLDPGTGPAQSNKGHATYFTSSAGGSHKMYSLVPGRSSFQLKLMCKPSALEIDLDALRNITGGITVEKVSNNGLGKGESSIVIRTDVQLQQTIELLRKHYVQQKIKSLRARRNAGPARDLELPAPLPRRQNKGNNKN